jgi:hypothetical protein
LTNCNRFRRDARTLYCHDETRYSAWIFRVSEQLHAGRGLGKYGGRIGDVVLADKTSVQNYAIDMNRWGLV